MTQDEYSAFARALLLGAGRILNPIMAVDVDTIPISPPALPAAPVVLECYRGEEGVALVCSVDVDGEVTFRMVLDTFLGIPAMTDKLSQFLPLKEFAERFPEHVKRGEVKLMKGEQENA